MNKTNLALLAALLLILVLLIYPTAFDKRSDVFAATKWGVDSLGIIISYIALLIGILLSKKSGGILKSGLRWFNVGMLVMGSAFWFGPVINHYGLINKDLVEGMHGVMMLGGMLGYFLAMHWLLKVSNEELVSTREVILYLVIFVVCIMIYYPTMATVRTQGNDLKYWTELVSFGISGMMVAMAINGIGRIGGTFRRALNWLLVSNIVMAISYPFGPISQPNHLWTPAQGGTYHHGIMGISILLFLVTVILFSKLDVYQGSTG